MGRTVTSLEERLRKLQLERCFPEPKPAAAHRRLVSYAFRAWKAYPHCPSWHRRWLEKRGIRVVDPPPLELDASPTRARGEGL